MADRDIGPRKRYAVYARDQWRCWYCGKELPHEWSQGAQEYPTLDHLIPQSVGGRHHLDNLVTACRAYNAQKREKRLEEYRAYLQAKRSPAYRARAQLIDAMAEYPTPFDAVILQAIDWLEQHIVPLVFWGEQKHGEE